jgi:hypothetical protein
MNPILGGALAMTAWLASLFFLRSWSVTRDRLFLFFSLAFATLGLNWLGLAWLPSVSETHGELFLLRLLAFTLIIVGVLDKNRRTPASGAQDASRAPPSVPGPTE